MSARHVVLVFAVAAALVGSDVAARSAGQGGGRMATASISGANAGADRPAHLPARPIDGNREARVLYNPYGWYWYGEWDEPQTQPEPEPQPQQAAPPPPPPPPPSVGTTLMALPPGCSTVERGGKFLRSCGGAFYEEHFEGDRVVYTVVQ